MMNNRIARRVLPFAVLVGAGFAAHATQGTFPHGYGVQSEGMGGVAQALPQDAVVGATNPAGLLWLDDRLDVGGALLFVNNGADFAGVRHDGSADTGVYAIPQFGVKKALGSDSSVGFSVIGNGVGTNYRDNDNVGGMLGAFSRLQQMVATASYAHRVGQDHSVGLGLVLARQVLDVRGPGSLGLPQGKDTSYGAGIKLGWTGKITPALTLGASYASKVFMGRLDALRGLLADQGKLDVPETFGFGAAYVHGPWTFAADVQQIQWRGVRSLGNPGVTRATGAPGSRDGAGFGWKDQTVWKLGVAYVVSDKLTLRAGYNDGSSILDSRDGYLGMLAPSANHRHYTMGATYRIDGRNELSLAYARSPKEKVQGTGIPPDALASPYMGQHWLSFSYGWRF